MENDLRKYELEQANEQIKMLHSFMPETFLRRGGEKEELMVDSIITTGITADDNFWVVDY